MYGGTTPVPLSASGLAGMPRCSMSQFEKLFSSVKVSRDPSLPATRHSNPSPIVRSISSVFSPSVRLTVTDAHDAFTCGGSSTGCPSAYTSPLRSGVFPVPFGPSTSVRIRPKDDGAIVHAAVPARGEKRRLARRALTVAPGRDALRRDGRDPDHGRVAQ